MAINKVMPSFAEAVADIPDGATIMIDGFAGPGGTPQNLIRALREQGARGLTIISNTAGLASVIGFGTLPGDRPIDIGVLIENEQVKKVIASYPVSPSPSRPTAFERAYKEGKVELELAPQGTLAERIRAGGAGIAAFYTPTGVGTLLAEGKETRIFEGREYVLERALSADFALLRAHKADTLGNVVYRGTSRNFNGVMATAARTTIVEVDEVVEPGGLDAAGVHTPGIYVKRIVKIQP
jgi:3-oxoacid CoA-transferase subunit A